VEYESIKGDYEDVQEIDDDRGGLG
jgi:hypothetical protein